MSLNLPAEYGYVYAGNAPIQLILNFYDFTRLISSFSYVFVIRIY